MNTRKLFIWLGLIDCLYLLIFSIYILSPVYLGYYAIGIVQLLLMIICIVILMIFIKKCFFTKIIRIIDFVIIILYSASIITMLYTLFIWYAFMPD